MQLTHLLLASFLAGASTLVTSAAVSNPTSAFTNIATSCLPQHTCETTEPTCPFKYYPIKFENDPCWSCCIEDDARPLPRSLPQPKSKTPAPAPKAEKVDTVKISSASILSTPGPVGKNKNDVCLKFCFWWKPVCYRPWYEATYWNGERNCWTCCSANGW